MAGRGRPRKRDNVLRRIEESHTQLVTVLRAPHFKDEMARILGDPVEPYGGLFKGADADTTKTAPNAEDRALLEAPFRTKLQGAAHEASQRDSITVHFGNTAIDAWYRGVYPNESRFPYLFICPFCLTHRESDLAGQRHLMKCERKCPPGNEIYRDGDLSVFQIDGDRASIYCQNLCMFAKLFLSSKQLYREVQSFYFFVLTERDSNGNQAFVGYFSKQKAFDLYKSPQPVQSVSCIFTAPSLQHKGYGQFLIGFSYLLVKMQHNTGSPETPLSDLGRRAYYSYWKRTLCLYMQELLDDPKKREQFTVAGFSAESGICASHVVLALDVLGWLKQEDSDQKYSIEVDPREVARLSEQYKARKALPIHAERIISVPFYELIK